MYEPPMDNVIECHTCNGDGWYIDHDPNCDGSCKKCPIQVQCSNCEGQGWIPWSINKEE